MNEKSIPDIAVDNLGNVIEENSRNEDDCFKKNYSVCNCVRIVHFYKEFNSKEPQKSRTYLKFQINKELCIMSIQ